MEKFLDNTPIPWVKVTDPSTGEIYYSTAAHEYGGGTGPDPTPIDNLVVDSALYAVTASYAMNGGGGGTQGATGAQGATGTQGIQGTTGAGTQGTTGTQGIQGITGTQGAIGTQGVIGAQGIQGLQGITGTQGAIGTQGITGAQGITGTQGTTGAQGIQGITGTQGTTGTQGVQGVQGSTGVTPGGTADYIPKFTGTTTLGNSLIYERNPYIGINTTNPISGTLHVEGNVYANSFTGSLFGTSSWATYANNADRAQSSSFSAYATSASFTSTASYVNPLRQNVTIGNITSTPPLESTLNIYPSSAGGTGEGGQILLAASGGLYSSASMLDVWQNQFRILRGSNTGGSNAGLVYVDLQSGNTQFVGAVTASAYSGLPNAWLHALRTSNQTIGSGTWASRDIIFDQVSSNNFTYNSSTGIATLRANKTYRLTARLAWSAAGLYTLKFRVYNQTTSAFTGPTVEMIQSPNGTYNVSDNTLEHVLAVGASDIDISIRTTSDTNALTGEYIRGDLNTQLIIQQIA